MHGFSYRNGELFCEDISLKSLAAEHGTPLYVYSAGTITDHFTRLDKAMAGVDIQHIPYKGTGPLITDLLSGQINMTIASIVPLIPQVRAGKLRPIAVTGSRRSGALPDVPTIAEAGVPGYDMTNWFGILAPAGLPAPILTRLDGYLRKIVAAPEVREVYAQQGADGVGAGPATFAKVIAADIPKWERVVRESGARVD
jgi:tripartite-type tricarboxylate transporter receptor subunit TctC